MNTTIRLNGEEKTTSSLSIAALLKGENIDPSARFIAVAINGTVVPRSQWADKKIKPDDEVEIVSPAPGG